MQKNTDNKNYIILKKEAYLFDTKFYIMKAFISVFTAYAIVLHLPLVQKDMISVLFGLMMTLEPVTVTGIRSGLKQITATIFGALATAVIITLFGINIWTVAFTVSATLFLCLKINWREVSPVAIFTSIYMTQYVQHTISGEPSVVRTFQLRILALGIGVFIAIAYNFMFSIFFYKKMEKKRIAHILSMLTDHMRQIKKGIEEGMVDLIQQEKELVPLSFASIDWLSSLIKDKKKEAQIRNKLHLNSHYEEIKAFEDILISLRNVTHLIYDTAYTLTNQLQDVNRKERQNITTRLEKLITEGDYLATHYENSFKKYNDFDKFDKEGISQDGRLNNNLNGIQEMLDRINDLG